MSTRYKVSFCSVRKALLPMALGLAVSVSAQAGGGHTHGRAEMTFAVDASTVTVRGKIPQESIVGYERAPSTDKEKAAALAALETLKEGVKLVVLSEAAACSLKSAKIDAAQLVGEKSAAPSSTPTKPAAKAEQHADVAVTYEFNCAKPEALTQMTVNLFDAFKGVKVVQVQFALASKSGARQKTARLVSAARTAKF